MKSATIKQFLEATRKEWQKSIKGAHPDDRLSFQDWLSEFPLELKKEWGIYKDSDNDEWRYDETNSNWEGDDLCDSCGCYYNAELSIYESNLCEICSEDYERNNDVRLSRQ
jgi:hypothetical protein